MSNNTNKRYTIVRMSPTTYIDEFGKAVNGWLITFRLNDYNEVGEVRVSSMDVTETTKAIEAVITYRDSLAQLG